MNQISFFDGTQPFRNNKPIRLIELFAGYGSQALALKYLGVPFEHHRISEWATKSIQAYKDIHAAADRADYSEELTDDEESVVWNNDLGCFVDAKTGEMIVGEHDDYPEPQKPNCRIRKLTPRECFRLMGVKREDYEAVAKHQSDSSQYHLAGDSIVTACLMVILGVLLSLDYNTKITELTEELLDADETNSQTNRMALQKLPSGRGVIRGPGARYSRRGADSQL